MAWLAGVGFLRRVESSSREYTLSFILNGKLTAQAKVWSQPSPGGSAFWSPDSLAWCCQACGDTWARMHVEPATRWEFQQSICPRCSTDEELYGKVAASVLGRPVPASLLDANLIVAREPYPMLQMLPMQLLLREFELTYQYIYGATSNVSESIGNRTCG